MRKFASYFFLLILISFSSTGFCFKANDKSYLEQLRNSIKENGIDSENNKEKYKYIESKINQYSKTDQKISQDDKRDLLLFYKKIGGEFYRKLKVSVINSLIKETQTASTSYNTLVLEYLDEIINLSDFSNEKYVAILENMFTKKDVLYSDIDNFYNTFTKNTGEEAISLIDDLTQDQKDIRNGKPAGFSKIPSRRETAKNDAISQVLNYSSGYPEDASGQFFYYPANGLNENCVYKLANANDNTREFLANEIATAMMPISPQSTTITLGKLDLTNVSIYTINQAKFKKSNDTNGLLSYQTRLDGVPADSFICDSNSCNIERLKRGWTLIRKKCKGTEKAF